jgi:hypothetical protein
MANEKDGVNRVNEITPQDLLANYTAQPRGLECDHHYADASKVYNLDELYAESKVYPRAEGVGHGPGWLPLDPTVRTRPDLPPLEDRQRTDGPMDFPEWNQGVRPPSAPEQSDPRRSVAPSLVDTAIAALKRLIGGK